MATTHQTQFTRSEGPADQLLTQHGQSVTINGTSYTAIVRIYQAQAENGQLLRQARISGLTSALPALPELTAITAGSDVWRVSDSRDVDGWRIAECHDVTVNRLGGVG